MRYYVYILLDDTIEGNYDNEFCNIEYKPFYVGKGDSQAKNKIKRHLFHYNETKMNLTKISNPHKYNKIKKLQESGFEPNFVIVYANDDENKVLEVESRLIKFYGKSIDGGLLTNITDGGVGGNLFRYIEGFREKLNTILSIRWQGENNPNYNRKREETYSFKFKEENGYHWNGGLKMTENHKSILKKLRYERLPFVEMICIKTLDVIDTLKTVDAIFKYNLNIKCFYKSLNEGGQHKGFFWKYQNKELILSKSNRTGYIKPKRTPKCKKVFYKRNINDIEETIFNSLKEASKILGINKEVIRRKCNTNNTYTDIFRYETKEYIFDVKCGKKRRIMSVDDQGNKIIYDSATEAAKIINSDPSAIIQVCKGHRNKHKNLKFKYI